MAKMAYTSKDIQEYLTKIYYYYYPRKTYPKKTPINAFVKRDKEMKEEAIQTARLFMPVVKNADRFYIDAFSKKNETILFLKFFIQSLPKNSSLITDSKSWDQLEEDQRLMVLGLCKERNIELNPQFPLPIIDIPFTQEWNHSVLQTYYNCEKEYIQLKSRAGKESAVKQGIRLGRKRPFTKKELDEIIHLLNENQISKDRIAKSFNISRTSLWRIQKILREEGNERGREILLRTTSDYNASVKKHKFSNSAELARLLQEHEKDEKQLLLVR